MTAIDFQAVRLVLGQRTVLENVSFTVAEGAFIGLLGPNGAGKTTLMRAILGLVPAAAGSIRVLGQPVARGQPRVGYLPQVRTPPPPRLRAWDAVAIAAMGNGFGPPWAGAALRREVDRVLALVDATDLAQRPLAQLSGGERQRVILAQALLGEPHLLLLDEPLSGLDLPHQRAVVDLVQRLHRDLRLTVLFSAHDLALLAGAVDSVLYLGRGQAVLGSVEEVFTRPVLSRLYGAPIEVFRVRDQIFVLADGMPVGTETPA